MPKMKTKSGAKKRFKVSKSGKVRSKSAFTSHMQINKPKSMKRKAKKMGVLVDADARLILRSFLPYSRKKKSVSKTSEGAK